MQRCLIRPLPDLSAAELAHEQETLLLDVVEFDLGSSGQDLVDLGFCLYPDLPRAGLSLLDAHLAQCASRFIEAEGRRLWMQTEVSLGRLYKLLVQLVYICFSHV